MKSFSSHDKTTAFQLVASHALAPAKSAILAPPPPLTEAQRERLRLIYPRVHRAYQRARMACPEIDMRVRATGGIELWFDLDTHWTRAAEQFLSDALVAYARGEVEADGISLHLNDYFDAHRIRWQDGTASRFYRQE